MPEEPIVNILSEVELINLNALTTHPGFSSLEKLHMALCDRANKELLKLDEAEEGYDRKVTALQRRAKVYNEFSLQILKACFWKQEVDKVQEQAKQSEKEQPNNPIIQRVMNRYERTNTTD